MLVPTAEEQKLLEVLHMINEVSETYLNKILYDAFSISLVDWKVFGCNILY
jgi:hypothetical protein